MHARYLMGAFVPSLPQLCLACRQRAPGWSDTISPEMANARASRKRLGKNHCKTADLHHVVEEQAAEDDESAEQVGRKEGEEKSGGGNMEKRFDPLLG
jgi:hypothetical protein